MYYCVGRCGSEILVELGCNGECTKCHLGIVRPDDSCEFGERRATTHV